MFALLMLMFAKIAARDASRGGSVRCYRCCNVLLMLLPMTMLLLLLGKGSH
jgi:hypothetical protein